MPCANDSIPDYKTHFIKASQVVNVACSVHHQLNQFDLQTIQEYTLELLGEKRGPFLPIQIGR